MPLSALPVLQYYVRRFPLSKGKQRAVNLLWKPLARGNYIRQSILINSSVKMSCDITKLVQRSLYFWGGYESEYCDHWVEFAKTAKVIFDVGANVGLYTLLAAEANPSGEIHAFEPTKELVQTLARNIQLNGFQNIRINATGVGRLTGQALLRECKGTNGNNEGMNYVLEESALRQSSDRLIPVVSIDEYCSTTGIKYVDLMKIDIEGGEYEALRGASGLLATQSIGYLFLELAEWAAARVGHSTSEITNLLHDAGYRILRLGRHVWEDADSHDDWNGENILALPAAKYKPLCVSR